jgi:DNA-binding NtrC family response regulator
MTPEANSPITVLFVNPSHEDYAGLSGILADAPVDLEYQWKPRLCVSAQAALRLMQNRPIPVVFCEHHAGDCSWKTFLEKARELPQPPCVIVTSRSADDHLWSEALNLGAYDVLATPFDASEVARVLGSAWSHWRHRAAKRPNAGRHTLAVSVGQ